MKPQQLILFGAPLQGPPKERSAEVPTHHEDKRPSSSPGRLMLKELPTDEQPRERLEKYGPSALATSELIEVVISSNHSLGREVLAKCESLRRLWNMPTAELAEIPGIGPVKAAQIKAALELGRRSLVDNGDDKPTVRSPADAANLVMPEMQDLDAEEVWVLLLDTRNHVLHIDRLYKGSLNTNVVRVGEVYREAVKRKAAAIIVCHNHPSSDPTPSPEDVKVTELIRQAGDILDIPLLDHVIIGAPQRFVSLKERGLGF